MALNKGRISSDYRWRERWNIHIEAIIVGNRFPGGDITNQGTLISGYTEYNMSVGYQWKYVTLRAAINNITNVPYINYAEVLGPTQNLETFYYPAPGRNFWISAAFRL